MCRSNGNRDKMASNIRKITSNNLRNDLEVTFEVTIGLGLKNTIRNILMSKCAGAMETEIKWHQI
jgi:hypothetical protein